MGIFKHKIFNFLDKVFCFEVVIVWFPKWNYFFNIFSFKVVSQKVPSNKILSFKCAQFLSNEGLSMKLFCATRFFVLWIVFHLFDIATCLFCVFEKYPHDHSEWNGFEVSRVTYQCFQGNSLYFFDISIDPFVVIDLAEDFICINHCLRYIYVVNNNCAPK